MPYRNRILAVLFAALALAPVAAAGRSACCATKPVAAVAHACCHKGAGAQASARMPCCDKPVAPKPETKLKDAGPITLAAATVEAGAAASAAVVLPGSVSVRLARRAHHAAAPDDSPPDRLARICVLLI